MAIRWSGFWALTPSSLAWACPSSTTSPPRPGSIQLGIPSIHIITSFLLLISIMEIIATYHFMIWLIGINKFVTSPLFHAFYRIFRWDGIVSEVFFCQINEGFYFYAQMLQFTLYNLFSIDLTITLRKPFLTPARRWPKYILAAFLLSILATFLIYDDIMNYCKLYQGKSPNISSLPFVLNVKDLYKPISQLFVNYIHRLSLRPSYSQPQPPPSTSFTRASASPKNNYPMLCTSKKRSTLPTISISSSSSLHSGSSQS